MGRTYAWYGQPADALGIIDLKNERVSFIFIIANKQKKATVRGGTKMEIAAFWKGFFNPPKDCAQTPFWFLNGEVDGEVYASQMDEMAEKGVCQAMPHPRFGMDRREYLTEHYFNAFRRMAENAREKGYRIHLYDEFNWSSGNAGGRLTEDRRNCALGIAIGTARTDGLFCFDRWEEGFLGWGKKEEILMVGYAPYRSEHELDFEHCRFRTDYSCEGNRFRMELEPGDWTAFVIYTVRTEHPSPLRQGNGSVVDYLNPKVTKQFIELTHEAYYEHLGEFFGETIPSIFYDEASPYASGNFSWTEELPAVFQEQKGYDILKKLPHLFFDCGAETVKVRCDYWDVVTRLFAQGFVGQIADWCGEHGIALTGHTHEDSALWPIAGNVFRTLRAQQWVGLDSLGGYKPYSCLKTAISAAHVSGGDMVICEALGVLCGGWDARPVDMKKAYNQLAIAGVNLLVPHGFFETVENPKVECPPSFFTCNPYWSMYRELSAMTDLQCYINRKMTHVADIAVFYPIVSWQAGGRGGRGRTFPWGIAEEQKEITSGEYEQFDRIVDRLMGEQMDLDIVDDVALEEGCLKDRCLQVGRESYRVLILPDMTTIRLADARRILQLAQSGLSVLASEGFAPLASAENGTDDPALHEVLGQLEKYLHRFRGEDNLVEQLRWLMPVDICVEEGPKSLLDAAHRRIAGVDLYLIFHTGEMQQEYQVSVRCRNRYLTLLDCRGRRVSAEFAEQGERSVVSFRAGPEEIYYFVLAQEEIPDNAGETSARADDFRTEEMRLIQKLGKFRFLPAPEGFGLWKETLSCVELALPVCRTRELSYESGDGDRLAAVWKHWMEPGFDDESWEVLSLKHGPKLYDHRGSRLFRFKLPAGTTAVRRPIPVNGEYALYLNGRLTEAVTGHVSESKEGEWIPVEGCEDAPGILGIESSSMMPQFGMLSPILVQVKPFEVSLVDWKEIGLDWYAGYGRYEAEFVCGKEEMGKTFCLDLGDVKECAAIFVNGKPAGQKLWKPYRFDLTDVVQEGTNILTVFCCNLIANEFAWDPLGTRGGGTCLPSGLLGEVRLYLEENDI